MFAKQYESQFCFTSQMANQTPYYERNYALAMGEISMEIWKDD